MAHKLRNWLCREEQVRAKDDFKVIGREYTAEQDFQKIPQRGRPPGSKGKAAPRRNKIAEDPAIRSLVQMMTACGVAKTKQAKLLRVSAETLNKHFSHELENGQIVANMQVAQALFNKAIEGDVRAQIFWLESKGGFQKVDKLEISPGAADNMSPTEKGQRLAAIMMQNPEIAEAFKKQGLKAGPVNPTTDTNEPIDVEPQEAGND